MLRSDRKWPTCARSLAAAATSSTNMRAAMSSSYEDERTETRIWITECAERQGTLAETHTEAQRKKRNAWTERGIQGNGQKPVYTFKIRS